METLTSTLFLTSLIFLEIGFFSHHLSLFWLKSERIEQKSTTIYGITLFFSFLLAVLFNPSNVANLMIYTLVIALFSCLLRLVLLMFNYSEQESNSRYKFAGILVVVSCIVFLPFHYIPSQSAVFPKGTLTFRHSIITETDILEIIERYNSANIMEKQAIKSDPIFLQLMERGIIENGE